MKIAVDLVGSDAVVTCHESCCLVVDLGLVVGWFSSCRFRK